MNDLQTRHTFGLSASCKQLYFIDQLSDLNKVTNNLPFWLLGEGSNCIFVDDYEGDVWINRLLGIDISETESHFLVKAASGENWHKLVEFCLSKAIYGFENLALIPGTVGAAPIQNIGAYGREIAEFIDSVAVFNLNTQDRFLLANKDCGFGYRDSIFKRSGNGHWFIEHVNFKLPKNNLLVSHYGELKTLESPTPRQIFDAVVHIRQSKLPDPKQLGNAGSFFKNPIITKSHLAVLQNEYPDVPKFEVDDTLVKVPAAWLIDQAGFKGSSLGGVQCHAKQPLVLLNKGSALGADVLELARAIQYRIKELFDIHLENEVRLIGNSGLVSL